MTGGRVRRMKSYIGDETFLLTYGDGLANIDLDRLIDFAQKSWQDGYCDGSSCSKIWELSLNGAKVEKFKEKPQTDNGWINGLFCC